MQTFESMRSKNMEFVPEFNHLNIQETPMKVQNFKLQNFRYGLATNSSSSHSIIYVSDSQRVPAYDVDQCDGVQGYGWGNFTLVTPEAKLEYIGQQVRSQLCRRVDDWVACAAASHITGVKVHEDGYIDHESIFRFPVEFGSVTEGPSEKFILDFKKWLLNESVVVIGGNDNGDDHPLYELNDETVNNPYTILKKVNSYNGLTVCRKDGDWWTLVNMKTGNKATFSFLNDAEALRPSAPELIDLKITDYCPFNCSFCYQDSTTEGQHAKYEDIAALLYSMSRMKVFEVAIGGGEPTLHPDFTKILEWARKLGVVPNFTTKSLGWIRGQNCKEILDLCGGFAYSVSSVEEMEKFVEVWEEAYEPDTDQGDKATIHYVMGTTDLSEFEKILKLAKEHRIKVTLLGYKTTGRGDQYSPHDYSNWIDTLKRIMAERWSPSIGIDTVLAKEYEQDIVEKLGTPRWMFYVKEGWLSMYFDAVELKAGPSSFCDDDKYVYVPMKKNRKGQEVPEIHGCLRPLWDKIECY